MIIRESTLPKKGTIEYEAIVKQVLDLYIVTNNATASYNIFRRAILGDEYKDSPSVRSTAKRFFERDENIDYIDIRKKELYRWGFDEYAKEMSLDVSKVVKENVPLASDVENLTTDELRNKNLKEYEDIKLKTDDNALKVQIIKHQTDLMDAKRREKETLNSDKLIHFYLPLPKCANCPECEHTKGKEIIR